MLRLRVASTALCLLLACNALAVSFDHVVTLGDSLLDDKDNIRSPVAAEHVANRLEIPLTKLAVFGDTSSDLINSGFHTQAAQQFGDGDLAMLWIGGNDFFENALTIRFGITGFLDTLEANVNTALGTLRSAGMEVVVFNLPDFAKVPGILETTFTQFGLDNFTAATEQWNFRLSMLASQHGATLVDVFTLVDDLHADSAAFSILGHDPVAGTSTGCQYCVFADLAHPSSFAQGYIANTTFDAINAAYDPGSTMPLEKLSSVEIALLADLLAGDFDENNLVDAADLADWQSSFGSTTGLTHFEGDSDGDGDNDGADLLNWQRQFGQTIASLQTNSTNIPEPSTALLLLAAACCLRLPRPDFWRAR